MKLLALSRRAASNCALGDLAGGNKSVDAALRELGAHGSHALLAFRAVLIVGATVSQIIARACARDGFAISEGLWGKKGKAG